ncbi:D-alanyl-D-alanine carboxypeptidase/D-alanyl-D-alanine-endopeptidase [Agromyces humatus]|uniref:D-alanyl-D-alanine carboxypeptidase/D-alanyl-D-alanine-endopeptidase n=1 Tax=Agromyces humatus TaxID=279573 RepID=A0ABN2K881_9MICO|nr:D-alanyl-D-alanine carboxypeptidase [Agromyces humatus]
MDDEQDATGATRAPGDPARPSEAGRDAGAATAGSSGPGASVVAYVRRHRLAATITAGALVLALAGTGAVFAGAATNADANTSVVPSATPTSMPEPARAVPAEAVAASRVRTCSVAEAAADPRLANLQAQVMKASTGEVLYDRGGTTASRTASVMKVLTSAAALSVLGSSYRATTTVVKGAEPGSVVLVGGGDVTLSRTPSGDETAYPGAAHLDELARQVREAWAADPANPPITKLILDASYFGGEEWHSSWALSERELGYMSNITALMVDGDRDDPYTNTSWRSDDPIGRAGQAFADELGGVGTIERGTAPAGAAQLGAVSSPTVAELIDKALVVSDNTVAEMLARLVAIETGAGNTFASLNAGILEGLDGYGVDTAGITIVDGSGLSPDNAVPPSYLTRLFAKVNAREASLGYILDSLPVSGERGSLAYDDRFWGDNSVADGRVIAKTGWIDTGYTLSGVIRAADDTDLTFAVYALGDVTDEAKTAIDTLTTAFYRCGDNLSNQ